MSPEILNLILWVPFLLLFASVGIPFCLKGFTKGLFHSLVSTGATLAAAFVSFFAARFVAGLAVSGILTLLPDISDTPLASLGELVPVFVEGTVTGLLALIIFAALLAILAPVCKFLLALLPTPKAKGLLSRCLGLALRFADGVILTTLLLLPIYGTIAAYGPAVDMAFDMNEQEAIVADETALTVQDYVQCAMEHPVVSLARTTPFSAIYNGLSAANTSGGAVNVPKTIQAITNTVESFQAILSGKFSAEDWSAFINAQKDFISADWFRTAFSSFVDALKSNSGEGTTSYLLALEELLALPKESFAPCYSGVLDWMSYASEKGLFQVIKDGNLDDAWITQSGVLDKAAEIQETMPGNFPLFDHVNQFLADSMAK